MKQTFTVTLAVLVSAAAAVLSLLWWLDADPDVPLFVRHPLRDRGLLDRVETAVDLEGAFRRFDGEPSGLPGSWPRFRGASFDNIAAASPPLAERWGPTGPPVLWSVALGDGYAGPAVRDGRVYVLDYDKEAGADALRCFSLDDGREIWRRSYAVRVKANHGMSRTVPAVAGDVVVTLGPKCHALCVEAATGAFRWGLDLVGELGAETPLWYTGQCPLVDEGAAVFAVGGDDLLIGVDLRTGEIAWRTPNPGGWKMSHSSVMPMTLGGRRMYVYCAVGGVAGVSAEPADRGRLLWSTAAWRHPVVAPSPVFAGANRVLCTAGYGAGSVMLEIVPAPGGGFEAKVLFELDRKVFACEQQTPIFLDGALWTVLPKDAGDRREELVCMRPDGEVLWSSGKAHRFGLGPFLAADGKLFVLDDDGVLTLARASAAGYEPLASARVLQGRDPWGPMALVGGRLLVRDFSEMICLDVTAGE